jgi:hypothetical protein
MVEMDCITLDNQEYAIIERIKYNNNNYVYLANTNVENDFMFRKVIIENNETYYCTLDTEEEFNNVVKELNKKIQNTNEN